MTPEERTLGQPVACFLSAMDPVIWETVKKKITSWEGTQSWEESSGLEVNVDPGRHSV